MRRSVTFVLALRQERLSNFPSNLVCKDTPASKLPKGRFKTRESNIPKSVDASNQHFLKPLFVGKRSVEFLLNKIVLFMLVWEDSITLTSFGDDLTLGIILNRPSLLTRSNALVRLITDI